MHDLSCVIHVHSRHSDGTGTVGEIARAAERAGTDVVIVTDHDTLQADDDGETGRRGSVLVLAGHEITPPGRNHMLAFGIPRVIPWKGRTPAQIAEAVEAAGGLGVAAHPFSRGSHRFRRIGSLGRSMRWEDLESVDGLEVWSFLADHGQALESIHEAVSFIRRPERHVLGPPQRNLDEWDRLCARRRVVGIGGLDAHQFGVRIGGRVLRAMGYHRTFRLLRTHVLAEAPDRDGVFDALRQGRCYIAAHFVAPAYGFRFYAVGGGGRRVEMGSEARAGPWELHVEVPVEAEMRLLRDGTQVEAATGDRLVHRAGGPGAYRVEVHREHLGAQRVWIVSNPVYLR